jgi:predicted ester cyclase
MPATDASERNRAVIERFYNEMWNRWDLAVADEIVAEKVRFHGSLGSTLERLEDFKNYMRTVRNAFPDWHNRIDELIVSGDRVVTRMSWSGTPRRSTPPRPGVCSAPRTGRGVLGGPLKRVVSDLLPAVLAHRVVGASRELLVVSDGLGVAVVLDV